MTDKIGEGLICKYLSARSVPIHVRSRSYERNLVNAVEITAAVILLAPLFQILWRRACDVVTLIY